MAEVSRLEERLNVRPGNGESLEKRLPVMISVLGPLRLTLAGKLVSIGDCSKSEHLLISLALARQHRLRRAHLLERIWPECDPVLAGQCLNSLTYELNKVVNHHLDGANLILHERGYYRLNRQAGIGVDLDYFETWRQEGLDWLRSGEVARGVASCERALSLYRGDLGGDPSIDTLIERERLRVAFLELLARLADHYYGCAKPAQALSYLQRLLVYDPCREDAHRQAIRCFMQVGQRSQALRQYQICRQALALEFEAEPEPATVELFNRIRLDPGSV